MWFNWAEFEADLRGNRRRSLKMMRMKNKTSSGVEVPFSSMNGSSGAAESGPAGEWEVRPGGMLVQKRNPDSDRNVAPPPTIRVRVKHGSVYHEISISAQASFGEFHRTLFCCLENCVEKCVGFVFVVCEVFNFVCRGVEENAGWTDGSTPPGSEADIQRQGEGFQGLS